MNEPAEELWQIAREGFANDAEQWLTRFITELNEAKVANGRLPTWFIYAVMGLSAATLGWSIFRLRQKKRDSIAAPGGTRG